MRLSRRNWGTPKRALAAVAVAGVLASTLSVTAVADEADNRTVDSVRAELAVANQQLEDSAIQAERASEAYNGARYQVAQAQAEAERTAKVAKKLQARLEGQQSTYADMLADATQVSPQLNALSGLLDSDTAGSAVEYLATLEQAEGALSDRLDEYAAAESVARAAKQDAADAKAAAEQSLADADAARSNAEAAHAQAAAHAQSIAEEKDSLVAELAEMQNVPVAQARQEQAQLEQAALEDSAAAAESEAREDPATEPAPPVTPPQTQDPQPDPPPAADPEPEPKPEPKPTPKPEPKPDPTPPPAASGGQAAIAFAKRQLGERYVWAAAGPNTWDCSGLTMKAWAQGGKSLPHWSVGQYRASTPIRASQLRPGDLVFWGSGSSSGSIYHVAMYIGNNKIIHAPRTGRPVSIDGLYYWRTPNFYARP